VSVELSVEVDVPLPEGNLLLYRRIYVLEQWLRRITMAALMSRYATQWRNAIPTEISKELKGTRCRDTFRCQGFCVPTSRQIVQTAADAGFAGVGLHSFFEEIESIEVVMAPHQRSRTSIDDGPQGSSFKPS
jgi:hypothetical protein